MYTKHLVKCFKKCYIFINELNNSIIYYYKLQTENAELFVEYKLVEIKNKKIENSVFSIPKHKDSKDFEKENKKSGRFKFYELTE